MKDNNILLANFIGMQKTNVGWYDAEEILLKVEKDNTFDILKFNTDWNWIMQVVEKIETLETKDGRTFTIDMHRDSVLIFEYGIHTNEIVFTEGKGRLDNLYNACVEFVEWWNKNN